ncbi:ATP-binding cassette domain-containing protein [Bradyrhizobium yuanmingense]|uniref:ABC transporter ATP-binding protein n=1 Tax=Bradyrhizobium TaxID=374 RepID=UPI0012FB1AEA|nr:oligopeptide/dipeptide ABC transporter ATP-binding protein [Bradyrhizobium yuanmingense]MDF0494261.1 ATP-binding cassette domain-containing protein [Bradyrhizobium yuanmingense]MVT51079.1 ATP-binding cassette domain-containing protein [Bradyrhizobium yuanmingense]
MSAVLEVSGLTQIFTSRQGPFGLFGRRDLRAVDDVSFVVARGRTFCLVGESGCGKTTIGRMVVRLLRPTAGSVHINGEDFGNLSGETLRRKRQQVQMVFQDPFACLNSRMTAAEIVEEPLQNFGIGDAVSRRRKVARLFDQVGLPQHFRARLPHHLSGGQRQRLGIARALAADPALIVADEAVAALDVSIRSQILNLLKDVQREIGISYLFISHDLAVVRYLADDVAVMYLGAIVEQGPAKAVFAAPVHPYTRALIDSVPAVHPRNRRRRAALEGEVPSAAALPSGCRFRTRCPFATDICAQAAPAMTEITPGHAVACHHAGSLPRFDAPGPGRAVAPDAVA